MRGHDSLVLRQVLVLSKAATCSSLPTVSLDFHFRLQQLRKTTSLKPVQSLVPHLLQSSQWDVRLC